MRRRELTLTKDLSCHFEAVFMHCHAGGMVIRFVALILGGLVPFVGLLSLVATAVGVPQALHAADSDIVEIMLCYDSTKNMEECSQRFIKSCLDQNTSSVEQKGVQKACLSRLTLAWDGIQGGLLRRAEATYTGEHKARFVRYVQDWARYDASACAFNAMDHVRASREMETLYCRLGRALKRAEFLIDVYQSAQVRDPTRPLP